MDHATHLAFLTNMTKMALNHAATTPNVPTQEGMSHDDILSFVSKMAKNGVEKMAAGGALGTQAGGIAGAINKFTGTQDTFAPQPGVTAPELQSNYNTAQLGLNGSQSQAATVAPGVASGVNSQNQLAGQLSAETQGGGPNPALTALKMQTGQNIAQQAALNASARGAGGNPGLLAEQNAENAGAIQQNAVGQEAALEQQQQLNAQNSLLGLSATQVGQGAVANQAVNTAAQGEQDILEGANSAANNVNAGVAQQNSNQASKTSGGLFGILGGAAHVLTGGLLYKGGEVGAGLCRMDKGGNVLDANARKHIAPHNFALPGGRYPIHDISHARNALARVSQNGTPDEKARVRAAVLKKYPGIGKADGGGPLPNVATPKMSGPELKSFAGKLLMDDRLMKAGGKVNAGPGENAVVKGDSEKNDKVPAMLSQGEFVIDRETMDDKGPMGQMARALAAHIQRRNKGKKSA